MQNRFPLLAKSIERVDSDFSDDVTWLKKLKESGFNPNAKTIWVGTQGFQCAVEGLSQSRESVILSSRQKADFLAIMRCGWQIVEGFLYYFDFERATRMLKAIQANSGAGSVLLADHINDFTLSSLKVGTTPSHSF